MEIDSTGLKSKTRSMRLIPLVFVLLLCSPVVAQSNTLSSNPQAGREFVMSCTYGVLAGTLVGAASLAFEEQPGDKLHNIARGASIGLYAGILLGVYVVYILPGQIERQNQRQLEEGLQGTTQFRLIEPPRVSFNPTFDGETGAIDGLAANYTVLKF